MRGPTQLASVIAAVFGAAMLSAVYYFLMQPLVGPTFSFDAVTPQEKVARVHLTRAVPVMFGAALFVSLVGGLVITRVRYHWWLWIVIEAAAGAVGFAAAEPFVPLTGPTAGPGFTERQVTSDHLLSAMFAGCVCGSLVGGVVLVAWSMLVGNPRVRR